LFQKAMMVAGNLSPQPSLQTLFKHIHAQKEQAQASQETS
jgi:hypothetical protein